MNVEEQCIKELKVEKGILGSTIAKLVSEFELKYGVSVDDLNITNRFTQVGELQNVITIEVVVKI